jgi:excisionase family DNA binding protein
MEMDLMTVAEVSEYLRVHPSTIYHLLKERRIPAFKVGNWRFLRVQIDEWCSNQHTKPSDIVRLR